MPKIINAYSDAGGSIADSLKSLGDSMFGDQSKAQYNRAHAAKTGEETAALRRSNINADAYANAVARGDRNEIARLGALRGETAVNASGYNLLSRSNHASGVDDPALAAAQIGAREPASATFIQQRRDNEQKAYAADQATQRAAASATEATNRAAQTQEAIDARTLVPTVMADGTTRYAPRSAANGALAPVSKDQALGAIVQRTSMPAPQQMPQTVPAAGPGAPPNEAPQPASMVQPAAQQAPPAPQQFTVPPNPYAHLPIEIQQQLGAYVKQVPYVEVATGRVGRSDGQRVYLPDGSIIPLQGTGFVPATDGQHSAMVQANGNRAEAAQPLPAPGAPPQAAADAAKTSGLGSIIQNEANHTVGFFTGNEIGADTNRARENLELLTQRTRQIGAGGRDSVQREKWLGELAPHPGALGMTGAVAEQQRNKVLMLTNSLRSEYGQLQAEAANPNTAPADVQRIATRMRGLRQLIQDWEKPVNQAPAAGGAPQGAPAVAPPTKRTIGQVYPTPKGPMEWRADGWHTPQAQQ